MESDKNQNCLYICASVFLVLAILVALYFYDVAGIKSKLRGNSDTVEGMRNYGHFKTTYSPLIDTSQREMFVDPASLREPHREKMTDVAMGAGAAAGAGGDDVSEELLYLNMS